MGVEPSEGEIDGVGGITRPSPRPLGSGLEAGARDGLSLVEAAFGDGRDAILADLFQSEGEEAIGEEVSSAKERGRGDLGEADLTAGRVVVAERVGGFEGVLSQPAGLGGTSEGDGVAAERDAQGGGRARVIGEIGAGFGGGFGHDLDSAIVRGRWLRDLWRDRLR